jgi:hypothetical protein
VTKITNQRDAVTILQGEAAILGSDFIGIEENWQEWSSDRVAFDRRVIQR